VLSERERRGRVFRVRLGSPKRGDTIWLACEEEIMAIIAISRGTFSGGQGLAELLGARLGYACVSREDLVESVTWYGVSPVSVAAAREMQPDLWRGVHSERLAYLMSLRAALCDRAASGKLVYHGHAAHLLLPGVSHVLKLRVVADPEFRIRAVMQAQDITHEGATAYIEGVDRERAEWANFLYGVEWDDPSLYDMVLNLSHLSSAAACEVVATAAQLDQFKPTRQSLKAVEDIGLGSHVGAELERNTRTRGAELRVVADGDVITVMAPASSEGIRDDALAVAEQVRGVREARWEVVPLSAIPRPLMSGRPAGEEIRQSAG
jgi:cytidylate kinase